MESLRKLAVSCSPKPESSEGLPEAEWLASKVASLCGCQVAAGCWQRPSLFFFTCLPTYGPPSGGVCASSCRRSWLLLRTRDSWDRKLETTVFYDSVLEFTHHHSLSSLLIAKVMLRGRGYKQEHKYKKARFVGDHLGGTVMTELPMTAYTTSWGGTYLVHQRYRKEI